ncbi:MAG: hypothetical protein IPK55_11215 [Streptococcus sp.]|nr:hypothetical protein [Streptococcus sp.]
MIEQEFKENRVFRYPEEYEVFDIEEQKAIKLRAKWQTTGPVDYDKLKEVGEKKRDTFYAEERSRANAQRNKLEVEKDMYKRCESDIVAAVQE